MRLFGNSNGDGDGAFRPDPTPDPEEEAERQRAQSEPEPEPEPEPEAVDFSAALADATDLNALYDADGEALYEDENGNPVTVEGQPIPATRAEAEAYLPQPEPEPTAPATPDFRSPFGEGLLSEAEQAELDNLLDPRLQQLLDIRASRMADRIVAAREQQRMAARSLGVDETVLADLAPRIAQVQPMIPANLRGTRQGAMAELMLAAYSEAAETGDFQGAVSKLVGQGRSQQPAVAPQKAAPTLLPPSARMPSPRANPETLGGISRTAQRARGPRDAANESFHKDGIDGDVVSILRRERKAGRF